MAKKKNSQVTRQAKSRRGQSQPRAGTVVSDSSRQLPPGKKVKPEKVTGRHAAKHVESPVKAAAFEKAAEKADGAAAINELVPVADGIAAEARKVPCQAADIGHAACPCPLCEAGRRNPGLAI